MFDLVDVLNSNINNDEKSEGYESVVFYNTDNCSAMICEAYRFEGLKEPALVENNEKDIIKFVNTHNVEVIILELTNCDDVIGETEKAVQYLPSHASIIVIGEEDSITIVRSLKKFGVYYLFWPTPKQEFIEFVTNVHENRKRQSGIAAKRRAKVITVVGTKGGVGCSLVSAELAYSLSGHNQASTVLVDHNYTSSNLDIMLGKKGVEKKSLSAETIVRALDLSSAQSLLNQVSEKVQLLAMCASDEKPDESHDDIRQVTDSVVNLISHDANFVIEDVSASVGFDPKPDWLCKQSDCIVLLLEPTVSSLREAGRIMTGIKSYIETNPDSLRVIVVVNNSRGGKFETVTPSEITHYLKHKIDISLPYAAEAGDIILQGERLIESRSKLAKPLKILTSLILGEESKKSFSFMSLFSR